MDIYLEKPPKEDLGKNFENCECMKKEGHGIVCQVGHAISKAKIEARTALKKEILEKIEWIKWDFKCECNMCYAHEKAVKQVLTLLNTL